MATQRIPTSIPLSAQVIAFGDGRIMDLTGMITGVLLDMETTVKGRQATVTMGPASFEFTIEGVVSQKFLDHLSGYMRRQDTQAVNAQVASFLNYIASLAGYDASALNKEFI